MTCPLESYKNSKEMRGAVSPLRVTLILTVPHLQLKRAGIWSLSSRTGNSSPYFPASSTLLILLWCLRFSPLYLHYDLCSCFVSHYQHSTLEAKHYGTHNSLVYLFKYEFDMILMFLLQFWNVCLLTNIIIISQFVFEEVSFGLMIGACLASRVDCC